MLTSFRVPKFVGSRVRSSSLSCAMLSLLVDNVRPCTSRSFHGRLAVVRVSGFNNDAYEVIARVKYLPMLNLTAVFAFPNRSYVSPNRGDMLGPQLGTSFTSGTSRGPVKRPA